MLQTILKVSKAAESVDWESVKSKYSDIRDLLVDALPDEITPGSFPTRKKRSPSKWSKPTQISSHHTVWPRYTRPNPSLCATASRGCYISCKVILSSIDRETSSSDANTPSTSGNLPVSRDISIRDSSLARSWINEEPDTPLGGESNDEEETEPESNTGDDDPMKKSVQQRRQFLDDKLKNYKQEKMKRKLPVDSQLLGCAQEELKIKRQSEWTRWIRSMLKALKECPTM